MLETSVLQFTFAFQKTKTFQNILFYGEREEVKLHKRENNLK